MKIFLDTANLNQIKKAIEWGICDGVTTNPTLVSKEALPFEELIPEICRIVPGPVSVEAVSTQAEEIIQESRGLARLSENVVIKIPITEEGIKAIRVLAQEGIKVNTTLVFSPLQALVAAKAGARFVSPFIGRLDDISHEGMILVEQIMAIFNNYGFDCEVIVASIRHPLHLVEASLIGADIATVPFPVLEKALKHPLTDVGLERFLQDWAKVKHK
ncbi:MAG: fructose-6-phosphate aldolase [Candidatus Aminicenantes bacterium 4484_214]|nr:MAG: fructose-6-phosphate aldolase [Candidatus Aminicenantes bacterium 4484_214]RLE06402.1 MAG: fructose-6-phosphate aldolase [Candidatus Aminicenantes bacterium]